MEVLALAQLVNQEQQRYRCCQNVFHFTNQKTLEPTREVNVSQDGGVEGVRGGGGSFYTALFSPFAASRRCGRCFLNLTVISPAGGASGNHTPQFSYHLADVCS